MNPAAFQLGVFLYAVLAMFVSSSMRTNLRENRSSSGAMVMTGWGLMGFSASAALALVAVAIGMAMGIIPEGSFALPL